MSTRDENRFFDVRTVERNLRKGHATRKDYERYLKNLPDCADNAVVSRPDESRDERREERQVPTPPVHAAFEDDEGAAADGPEGPMLGTEPDEDDEDEGDEDALEPGDDADESDEANPDSPDDSDEEGEDLD